MVVNRKALKKQMDEAAERVGGLRFLKKGTTRLRILEFEDEDGDTIFSRLLVDHAKVPDFKSIGVCKHGTFGEACVHCRINEMASLGGRDRVYSSRSKYLIKAIAIDSDAKRVVTFSVPTSVWKAITEYVLSEDWADVLEAETGHCFEIEATGDKLEREYHVTVMRKAYPVAESIAESVVDPLTELKNPSLEDQAEKIGISLSDIWDENQLEEVNADVEEPETTPFEGDDKRIAAEEEKKAAKDKAKKKKATKKKTTSKKDEKLAVREEEPETPAEDDDRSFIDQLINGG